jgi:hypothetical protein
LQILLLKQTLPKHTIMRKYLRLKPILLTLALLASPFALRAQDVGIYSIPSPAFGECSGPSTTVSVVIKNYGTSSVSSVPVTVSTYGTYNTTVSGTYSKTLAAGATDTLVLTGFKTTGGGWYTVNASTKLSGDKNSGNDARVIKVQLSTGSPVAITAKDSTLCGAGYAAINIPRQPGVVNGWFTDMTGQTLTDTGFSNYQVISSSKNFYAQSFGLVKDSITTTNFGVNSSYIEYSSFFNVKTHITSILDSLDIYFNNTNSKTDSIEIWMHEGG